MDKYIYDKSNGLWYELKRDDYFPCLTLPESEDRPIGICLDLHYRRISKRSYQIFEV